MAYFYRSVFSFLQFKLIDYKTIHLLKVLDAIDAVLRSNIPIRPKLNCVVMRGMNEDEIINFVDWTQVRSSIALLF